jgi:hypothetical protein
MAWRQPGKLRPPPHPQTRIDTTPDTRLVPRRRGAGAVERADDHTKHPVAVGNLAAAKVRNRSISTHGLDPPRALATAAWRWAPSPCRRSPALAPARRVAEATCSWTSSRSSRPLGHGGGHRDTERAGEAGPVEGLAPRPDSTLLPDLPSLCAWAGRGDERDHAHRPDGPDKAVPSSVDMAGLGGWASAGLGGQAARAGVGSGWGSGSGIAGCGRDEGAPGQLAGVWSPSLCWLVEPLSQ